MRRTDLMDTNLRVHREKILRLRQMTPGQRFRIALDLTNFGAAIHKRAMLRVEERRKAYDGSDT
jgi:hypothetical protein